ncbi:miraculin-like [Solanum tuberosum]|uniref:miraculin-like n=1 Tax=Solanum tuberosum TaxID=4113 RepID=UPI0003D26271|nr:PREDICTED: miraculin-like [Solanum tuberosum]
MNKVLILVLLYVVAIFTSSNSAPESDPILDINGKILRTHTTYLVVPVNHKYGGISLETTGNEKCQLGVVQEIYNVHGGSVALFPLNPKKGVIRVSTDLNIAILFIAKSFAKMLRLYDQWTETFVTQQCPSCVQF